MQRFFLGRQPIFDVHGDTYGYELLFRSSNTNAYDPNVDGDSATSQVLINAVVELGIEPIVNDKLAFINLTNRFLEEPELLMFLPVERVVLEVLETIEVNDAVINGIKTLTKAGYKIALDDFIMSDEFEPLLEFANIIKYDITQYEPEVLKEIVRKAPEEGKKILAERVETFDEFSTFRDFGFDYFQGYYFAKPNVLSGTKIPGDKLTLLQLLSQLNNRNVTMDEITDIMSREVSLGVRAMKYVNSPMSGLKCEVTSIKQAAVLLGRNMIRSWVTVLMMSDMSDKPLELVSMALIRARFCQLTAQRESIEDDGFYFTVGLLSLLDAMMDLDMDQILDNMTASQEFRDVLQLKQGRASELLDAVRILEANHSESAEINVHITQAMNDTYIEAIGWTNKTSQLMAA